MIELEKLPAGVIQSFLKTGIEKDDILLTMKTDITSSGIFGDAYIVMTKDRVVVLEGALLYAREGVPGKRASRVEEFREERSAVFYYDKAENPEVENLISTGRITLKYDGEPAFLFNFSSTYKHDAGVFCRAFEQIKEKGELDENVMDSDSVLLDKCPKCGRRYPDQTRKICPKCMDKIGLMKKIAKMFMRYKLYIGMVFLCVVSVSLLGVLAPYINNKFFISEVLEEDGAFFGRIWFVVGLMVAINFVSHGINILNGIISAKLSADVTYDLKKLIFHNLSRLSLSFFTNRQTGGLMTQINNDSTRIYWFFCDGFPWLVLNVIQIIAIMVIMFIMNPLLSLYAFVTIPIFFITFKALFNSFGKMHAKAYSRRRSFNSLISDVINGMRVVKSFSQEKDEMKRFDTRSTNAASADTEINIRANKVFPFLGFTLRIGSFIVWGVGGWQVMRMTGGMDYATLVTFVTYFSLIYGPIDFLADVSNWWSECLNSLQRLFEITEAVPEVKEKDGAVDLKEIRGEVEFDHVSFSYEANRKVIDDVSFSVPAGGTLGIVGHTGAGKSTIANLVTRLYDAKEGEIRIDGVNVKELSFATMRQNVAIVSQETYLFRGSIMDNIRYARPDATNEEVLTAAVIASAHQFIVKYPEGYHTQIGLGNKDLSGGERQRISIARAILKNPKILILDEATAAMDTQTERKIQQALGRLSEGRTTIMIAHRLSTLRDADRLIVIENGKMPESGTAAELLAQKGVYHKLYTMQAEALKTIGIDTET